MSKDYKSFLYGIKDFPLYITNYIYPSLYIKYKNKLYSVYEIEKKLADYIEWNEFNPDKENYIDTSNFEEFSAYINKNKNKVKSIIIQLIKKKIVKQDFENVNRV